MFLKYWFGDTSSSRRQYATAIEELCHQFSLADLRKSTKNFDSDRLIGHGRFGSELYKGCLRKNLCNINDVSDYTVSVKRFQNHCVEQFKNEVELLCQLRHPNIISLIGFCNHENEKILVFDYMSNGSLDRHLRGEDTEALSWKKRLEICIGAARGLHYLHAGAKRTIIHRDINPCNILLDDNMEPRLTDFDLSVKGARFMSKQKPIKVDDDIYMGTLCYIAVEHLRKHTVTDKSDVYSFGMVLLEVVWGRKFFGMAAMGKLGKKSVERETDPNIKGKIAPECWQVFIDITQRCLNLEPDERPTMGEVEVQLEHALSLQEQADISNTHGSYTLFSTTITQQGRNGAELETVTEDSDMEELELETITEDSDSEEM